MPISPPNANPDTLAKVLENARAYSIGEFNVAFSGANITPPQPAATDASAQDRENAKAAIAAYEKAKRAMAAAMQQVTSIDRQAGEAALLSQASSTATKICKRIESLMGTETANPANSGALAEIDTLVHALTALAALAPAALWKDSADSAGSAASG